MTSSRKTTQYLMVNDMDYVVKCNNKYDFETFINQLETLDYKWCDGDKLKEFNPYLENNVASGLCIYILINPNDKLIEYTFSGDHFNKDTIIYNPTVIILKLKNYKPQFEELKCKDFNTAEACKRCPFYNRNDLCGILMTQRETFGELFKRIEKEFHEAKETYEKGDKND